MVWCLCVLKMPTLRAPGLSDPCFVHSESKAAPGKGRSLQSLGHLSQSWALGSGPGSVRVGITWGGTIFHFSIYKKKGAGSRKQPLTERLSFTEGLVTPPTDAR